MPYRNGEGQILAVEKLLCLPEAVSSHGSICCDNSQVSGAVSLDCAIVDLSSNVFCSGMAYIAISRVRTLEGLHLTAFDSKSISVNNSCLKEVNRLCSCFRKDIYEIHQTPIAG